MIIPPSNHTVPREPMLQFQLEFSRRHEALEPGIQHLTDASWKRFLSLISSVNLAHRRQVRIQEGSWYLRHSIVATRHEISACAASAVEVVQEMSDRMEKAEFWAPDFDDLAECAITFAQSICEDPGILSIRPPQPPTTVIPSESPQI